jgi:hypothetical protein
MQAGKAAKRANGGYVGGRLRSGLRAKDRPLEPHPEERKVLAQVRKLRRQGLSYREIVRDLDAAGYRPRAAASLVSGSGATDGGGLGRGHDGMDQEVVLRSLPRAGRARALPDFPAEAGR